MFRLVLLGFYMPCPFAPLPLALFLPSRIFPTVGKKFFPHCRNSRQLENISFSTFGTPRQSEKSSFCTFGVPDIWKTFLSALSGLSDCPTTVLFVLSTWRSKGHPFAKIANMLINRAGNGDYFTDCSPLAHKTSVCRTANEKTMR